MKNKFSSILSAAVILSAFLVQSGCDHSPPPLVFEHDQKLYVIEEGATVSIFTPEGMLVQSIGTPGAGADPESSSFPSEILRFLLAGKGSISGIVLNDSNGNRIADTGEPGMQNVRVFVDNDNNGVYTLGDNSALTDAAGNYTIRKVRDGTRSIHIDTATLPGGWGFTSDHPVTLSVDRKEQVADVDFFVQDQSGEIRGTVRDQTDDVPMPGVLVYLDQNNDSELTIGEPHDTTDSFGSYRIANLPGGIYKFNIDDETIDSRYYQPPGAGTSPTEVALAPGESLTIDRAYVHSATISGMVLDNDGNPLEFIRLFIDLNGNGIYDAGEPVTVTDQFGNYLFANLPPGIYTIVIPIPEGHNMLVSPGPVVLNEGDDFTGGYFLTEEQPAAISGFVWEDADGNGKTDVTESGLAGVTVFLDDNNNGLLDGGESETVTDATGTYSFTGLDRGEYFIRVDDEVLRNEYIRTTGSDSIHCVLVPGQIYERAKFGFQSKLAPVHTMLYPARLSWGDDGNLYVTDNATGSVFIYDTSLQIQGELKYLAKPLGVAVDSTGNIHVGNQGRKNVEVYDASGNLLRTLGDGTITTPNDIAFDRAGNIYILDSSVDSIRVFDQSGNPTGTIIDGTDRFDYAVSIAIDYHDDGAGNEIAELYVADQPNCTIHVYALGDGSYQRSIGSCGSLYTSNWDGKFAGLVAVDIDQYGYIHGLDNSLNVVQVFDRTGTFVRSYNAYLADNEFSLNLQTDITIHPADDRVIIGNAATQSVEFVQTAP